MKGGESVLVEIEEAVSGLVPAAPPGKIAVMARESFENALENVKPMLSQLLEKFDEITEKASEIQIQFGLKLAFSGTAIIASGSTEANFQITVKWAKPSDK